MCPVWQQFHAGEFPFIFQCNLHDELLLNVRNFSRFMFRRIADMNLRFFKTILTMHMEIVCEWKGEKAILVQRSAQETHCLTQLHMQHVIHVLHETWLEQMIKVLEEDGCKYVIAEKNGNTAFKEHNQQNGSLEMRLLSNMWKTLGSSNSSELRGGRKKTGEECSK